MSDRGRELLAEWEGVRLHVYKDSAGHSTIGVGHFIRYDEESAGALTVDARRIPYREGISLEEAMALLGEDLRWTEDLIARRVRVPLAQHQFDALVSFAFNIGPSNFTDSSLLRKLNSGDYAAVPSELMKWVNAGGSRLNGLIARRQKEGALWEGKL